MWHAVAYLLLLVVIGIPGFIIALLWALGFAAVLQPVWGVVSFNGRPADTTVTVLAGLLTVVLMPWAACGIAGLNRAMARRLLAPRDPPQLTSSRANPSRQAE